MLEEPESTNLPRRRVSKPESTAFDELGVKALKEGQCEVLIEIIDDVALGESRY